MQVLQGVRRQLATTDSTTLVLHASGIVDGATLVLHAKKDEKLNVATPYPTTSPVSRRQSNQTATSTATSANPHGSKADVEPE